MKAFPIPLLVAATALFFALVPSLPYGYFQLLRFLVCGVSCYGAFMAMERSNKTWMWLFICLAVLFNPIIKIRFDREIWQVIDAAAGLLFGVTAVQFRKQPAPSPSDTQSPH